MERPQASIAEALRRLVPLSDADVARVADAYVPQAAKKRTMLLQAGEVCDFEAFVVKGCLRMYFIDEKGKEITLLFAPEGWWVGDLASFTQRMPSRFFIECVEDSAVLRITFAEKEKLFAAVPLLERAFRLAVQRHLSALQDRFVQVLSSSAEVCYTDFLQKYPGLSERIPQQLVASYVGITPEFLSKLRGRMSRRR
ncbi:MAG TPA: Crp/Fnr family transcriptional regulator [Flavobacteriales bacterium]